MPANFAACPAEAVSFRDPVTGHDVLQLTNASERSVHGYYDNPPWCRVTGRIAFSRLYEGADEGEIYMMDGDGQNLTHLARSRLMTANDGAMAQWSADGSRVYYRDRERGQPLIAWVDVHTGEQGAYAGDLRMFSPTGNSQVYFDNHSFYPNEEVISKRGDLGVYVQNLNTGQAQRLVTVEQCWQIHPRRDEIAQWHLYIKHTKWAPDGKRLLFVFTNEIHYENKYNELPRVKDVYVINVDGSGLKRVGAFGNHPIWHPNSMEVLTNSPWQGRGNNSLVLSHVDTGEQRLAATCIAGSGHPSYAPDGRTICVDHVLSGEGHGSLNLIDITNDQARHLLQMRVRNHTHTGTHLHPVWSRDGKQILYASDASGVAQLCVVNV